jgi:hypothetical protein
MRLQGVLLFLFVPLVLGLLLRQPLGPGWSVGLAIAIVFGHRLVAEPWAAKFADVRCLWCGRTGGGRAVPVLAGGRQWQMLACSEAHAARISRFLGFLVRFRTPIGLGIGLPLAWLVVASLAAAAGRPLLSHAANALVFRLVVAATVVAASLAPFVGPAAGAGDPRPASGSPRPEPLRCPFPIHNLSLLGIGHTLWIFRAVGAWWLVDGLIRLTR